MDTAYPALALRRICLTHLTSYPQLKRDVVTETKIVELVIVADNSEVSVLTP